MNTFDIFEWTLRLASVGVFLCSLELLVRRAVLRRPGLLASEIVMTRSPYLLKPTIFQVLSFLFQPNIAVMVLILRIVGSTTLIAASPTLPVVIFLALSGVYLSLRSPYGLDGSDQMTNIVFCACALGESVGTENAREIVLVFLAATVCQAYFVSGLEKLKSGIWRSGKAIPAVALTRLYGIRKVGEYLGKAPLYSLAMAWFVILFEVLFPLGLLAPSDAWWVALISAGTFHLFAAIFMGLNTFFWAFLSTYPAVIFCRSAMKW